MHVPVVTSSFLKNMHSLDLAIEVIIPSRPKIRVVVYKRAVTDRLLGVLDWQQCKHR